MSSLIVAHDSRLMLLEIVVEKLHMPWIDVFDAALMKKTIIMFRMLDDEWTVMMPNRRDYQTYRGSNYETEQFHGGRSVLFSVPEAVLEEKMSGVDLQLSVYRGISKYFELEPQRNFGFTLIRVDDLLNGIIKDLAERKELEGYFSRELQREPISRSTRGTFALLNDKLSTTDSTIELYIRISYLDKCVITEMHAKATSIQKAFYAREETDQHYRYQFRELNTAIVESLRWGSTTILPPLDPDNLICECKTEQDTGTGTGVGTGVATGRAGRRGKPRSDIDKAMVARLQAEVQRLLALMKEMRKNRPEVPPIGEQAKKVCPPTVCVCPCRPPCNYAPPPACSNQATICCLPSSC